MQQDIKEILKEAGSYWMEIPSEHSLTKMMAEGYYAMPMYGGYNDNYYNGGFEYKIVPLNTSLSARGNDNRMLQKWENNWQHRIYVGMLVSGECPMNHKEYTGHVINFSYRPSDQNVIEYIWIFDEDSMKKVPLSPKTVYPEDSGHSDKVTSYKKMQMNTVDVEDVFRLKESISFLQNKIFKNMKDFSVRSIMEEYYSNTEQMTQALKDVKKLQKLQDKTRELRREFIQNVMGKSLYKKYDAAGLFAPVPMNALKITFKDFADLNTDLQNDPEKTGRMIDILHEKNYRYKELSYGETPESLIRTNIVFETIDDIIDFFFNILSAYKRVFRTEDINWKPIVKKFRAYLN